MVSSLNPQTSAPTEASVFLISAVQETLPGHRRAISDYAIHGQIFKFIRAPRGVPITIPLKTSEKASSTGVMHCMSTLPLLSSMRVKSTDGALRAGLAFVTL